VLGLAAFVVQGGTLSCVLRGADIRLSRGLLLGAGRLNSSLLMLLLLQVGSAVVCTLLALGAGTSPLK